jgi:hypothetical protein
MTENPNPNVQDIENTLDGINDSTPNTWINGNLWRATLLYAFSMLIQDFFLSTGITPAFNLDFRLFWMGIDMTVVPIVIFALQKQAGYKYQKDSDAAQKEKQALQDQIMAQKEENLKLKAELLNQTACNQALKDSMAPQKATI